MIMKTTKRGLSPLISAVLLIAFTITLFLLISNWIKISIVDETTSKTEEKLSGQLDCMSTSVDISNVQVKADGTKIKLNVDNTGDTNIDGLTIRVLNDAGEVGSIPYTAGSSVAPLGRVLSKTAEQTITPAVIGTNKVEVYPKISSGVCKDQVKSTSNIGSY